MRRNVIAILAVLVFAVSTMAAVKPIPKHPGQSVTVAKTSKHYEESAAHYKKMAAYLRVTAENNKFMAADYKKLGKTKLAMHHTAISKNMMNQAKEYDALANTHKEHAKTKK